jgi:hypothetical protein
VKHGFANRAADRLANRELLITSHPMPDHDPQCVSSLGMSSGPSLSLGFRIARPRRKMSGPLFLKRLVGGNEKD